MAIFTPNTFLHIEDCKRDSDFLYGLMCPDLKISGMDSGLLPDLRRVDTTVFGDVPDNQAQAEIERLVQEAGEDPVYLWIATGQVATGYLERCLPAGIVSDSDFKANGSRIIAWMKKHDLGDYAFIGYSATPAKALSPEDKEFYIRGNSRHFCKHDILDEMPLLRAQMNFAIRWNREIYGTETG